MQDTILVLSQNAGLAGLIARTLRYRQVYCEPLPLSAAAGLCALAPRGVVLAEDEEPDSGLVQAADEWLAAGIPLLALGGAAIALCRRYGGGAEDEQAQRSAVTLSLNEERLFAQIDGGERVLGGFWPLSLPEALVPIATATERQIGYRHAEKPLYAMQYHIERNDPDSAQLLFNFACGICGCTANWNEETIVEQAVSRICETAPEGLALCAVSGGVDSAVCARLAQRAVGDRLRCLFVDTGLFRQNEPDEVTAAFEQAMGLRVRRVDERARFLSALAGVRSSEEKERITSQLMTCILLEQLSAEPDAHTLIMGTNFNDELFGFSPSAEMTGARGGANFAVCEPVRNLFKDEVRRLAATLELPEGMAERRPFPASGLALRVTGDVTRERLDLLRALDARFTEEICEGGFDKRLWQYYVTLTRSPDDAEGYEACLRALQAGQGGACAARLPFDLLERVTGRMREETTGVSRVVYDLTPSAHYGELE